MSWEITGYTGTDPTKYFLGTTDAQPLVVKTSGVERLRIDGGATSINRSSGPGGPIALGGSLGWSSLQLSYVDTRPLGITTITGGSGSNTGTWVIKASASGLDFAGPGPVTIDMAGVNWGASNDPTTVSESLIVTHTENGRSPGVTFMNDGGGHFVQQFKFGADSKLPNGVAASLWADWNGLVLAANERFSFRIGGLDSASELDVTSGNVTVTGKLTVSDDVILTGADCAEEFDVSQAWAAEPGTVMVLDDDGGLHESRHEYDKKVAGVISGAGSFKPAITLDRRKPSEQKRAPLALVGKVYCKVDAQHHSIEVGDLLTTSSTPGHAMKAGDALKSFGSVIGKALRPLQSGQGMIPILVALQ